MTGCAIGVSILAWKSSPLTLLGESSTGRRGFAGSGGYCPDLQEHEFSQEQPSQGAVDNPLLQQLLNVLPNSEQQACCFFVE
jgi:hypothetical protein